ncbi:DNA repair RAD51 homolog 3, partial [Paramuricea clavata]
DEWRYLLAVTDASFSVERLASIAKGLVKQLTDVNAEKSPDDQYSNMDQFTVEYILSNIQVAHCLDRIELIAASHQLPDQIRSLGQVKLIIVENIANPFRCEFASHALRGRILSELAQRFLKIAYEHDLAVVFTNQMTTTRAGKLVPCLGQYWGHSCSNRVILAREGKYRMAHLKKSSWGKETTVSYIITEEGVRSAPESVQCRPGSSSCMMRFDDILMRICASF